MAAKRKGAHVSLAKQEVPWDAEKQRRTAATAAIPPPMIVKTEKGQWCAVRSAFACLECQGTRDSEFENDDDDESELDMSRMQSAALSLSHANSVHFLSLIVCLFVFLSFFRRDPNHRSDCCHLRRSSSRAGGKSSALHRRLGRRSMSFLCGFCLSV